MDKLENVHKIHASNAQLSLNDEALHAERNGTSSVVPHHRFVACDDFFSTHHSGDLIDYRPRHDGNRLRHDDIYTEKTMHEH